MSTECLFCKIANKELVSYQIYENADFFVILDIHPINLGHLLIVTRKHVESYYDLNDDDYTELMLLAKKFSLLLKGAINPLKVVIHTSGVGNKHVHIHVIPVYSMYDIVPKEVLEKIETNPSAQELKGVQEKLLKNLKTMAS